MLDLDRFKTVNDSLGHRQGDQLLRAVADRLRACVREGDTVARLGGDEFVVVLSDMADVADIVPVAQKILGALAEPIGRQLSVNTSLGIAVYPRRQTADALLQYADTAISRQGRRRQCHILRRK
jgi:diguanylate cyclase (GGDEF)-like protein